MPVGDSTWLTMVISQASAMVGERCVDERVKSRGYKVPPHGAAAAGRMPDEPARRTMTRTAC